MAGHDRTLRRAVARLSECAIEDVEHIWSSLDTVEQARLRPLLADAGGIVLQSLSNSDAASEEVICRAQRLDRFMSSAPSDLTTRLLHSLRINGEDALLAVLERPVSNHRAVKYPAYQLTAHAGKALIEAALATQPWSTSSAPTRRARAWDAVLRRVRRWGQLR